MKFLLIYGSQTGQSEAVAEQIATMSEEQGLEAELLCGEEVTPEQLHDKVVVFVVSSTGDGDPPENFESFWYSLHDTPPQNLTFALLGLGDSNYTSFGGFPQNFLDFLTGSGAKSFYEYQLADDQVGLELVVEPWIEGLWEPLKDTLTKIENPQEENNSNQFPKLPAELIDKLSQLTVDKTDSTTKPVFSLVWTDTEFTHSFPHGVKDFMMPFCAGSVEESRVLGKKQLTHHLDLVKEVVELELSTGDTGYSAGDSLGVLAQNSDTEVTQLLNRLRLIEAAHTQYTLTPNAGVKARLLPKHVLLQCSPWYALKFTMDIHSVPKKAFLAYLSECCGKEEESQCLRYLASKEGSEDLNQLIYTPGLTLLEILSLFPSCAPSFSFLLQFLPRLTPRYYSVSRIHRKHVTSDHVTSDHVTSDHVTSDHVTSSSISFVFNHVTSIREGVGEWGDVPGVCTSWLRSLNAGDPVYIYRRKNESFRPDLTSDCGGLIMIGAGTGVAPFLGFLDHVQESGMSDVRTLLITGNRYRDMDSIYADYFRAHSDSGVLTHYRTAHSRDRGSQCRYVQDILSRDSAEIGQWLDNNARIFVCGDAKGLGAAVFSTFKTILCDLKNVSENEALQILSEMKKNKQYCEDIWS